MKPPILNHVALTVSHLLVSDTPEYEPETLTAIVARAQAYRAERDPAVEVIDITTEYYCTIRIHNAYIRYLLPLMVAVQYYEGVEARLDEV